MLLWPRAAGSGGCFGCGPDARSDVQLRAVLQGGLADAIEDFERQAVRIIAGLQHQRRHGADDQIVQLAQKALRRGRPLKIIAAEVGYGSEAALSRAFKAHTGQASRQWKAGTPALRGRR